MGEHILYNGRMIKIGTCEDLYYTRIDDLRQVIESGKTERIPGNLEPADYLKPENGFRFRFPFPDEDGVGFGNYWDYGYDRGLPILLDAERSPNLIKFLRSEDWLHYQVVKTLNIETLQEAFVSVTMPCPYSHDWEKTDIAYVTIRRDVVLLVQQRQVEGVLWPVIGCPYCQARVRLEPASGEELIASIEAAKIKDWREISRRIRAGYQAVTIPEPGEGRAD